ncbi:hypothetical protein HYH03_016481 [Edaphochlamys debaryana]|uniref:Uncharacterized protein n=1 Tax=Edaphochlamys debaryana TaxID=47281 RepID=A0A836BRF1_9CHLO|nr:hypothetical protein HYH03_016481 [Edaphochlamys debaryana]|eukprot:KAG2484734.1 hypothetical protein HYH03_016481 [Edaphochlamys debaryana]
MPQPCQAHGCQPTAEASTAGEPPASPPRSAAGPTPPATPPASIRRPHATRRSSPDTPLSPAAPASPSPAAPAAFAAPTQPIRSPPSGGAFPDLIYSVACSDDATPLAHAVAVRLLLWMLEATPEGAPADTALRPVCLDPSQRTAWSPHPSAAPVVCGRSRSVERGSLIQQAFTPEGEVASVACGDVCRKAITLPLTRRLLQAFGRGRFQKRLAPFLGELVAHVQQRGALARAFGGLEAASRGAVPMLAWNVEEVAEEEGVVAGRRGTTGRALRLVVYTPWEAAGDVAQNLRRIAAGEPLAPTHSAAASTAAAVAAAGSGPACFGPAAIAVGSAAAAAPAAVSSGPAMDRSRVLALARATLAHLFVLWEAGLVEGDWKLQNLVVSWSPAASSCASSSPSAFSSSSSPSSSASSGSEGCSATVRSIDPEGTRPLPHGLIAGRDRLRASGLAAVPVGRALLAAQRRAMALWPLPVGVATRGVRPPEACVEEGLEVDARAGKGCSSSDPAVRAVVKALRRKAKGLGELLMTKLGAGVSYICLASLLYMWAACWLDELEIMEEELKRRAAKGGWAGLGAENAALLRALRGACGPCMRLRPSQRPSLEQVMARLRAIAP